MRDRTENWNHCQGPLDDRKRRVEREKHVCWWGGPPRNFSQFEFEMDLRGTPGGTSQYRALVSRVTSNSNVECNAGLLTSILRSWNQETRGKVRWWVILACAVVDHHQLEGLVRGRCFVLVVASKLIRRNKVVSIGTQSSRCKVRVTWRGCENVEFHSQWLQVEEGEVLEGGLGRKR